MTATMIELFPLDYYFRGNREIGEVPGQNGISSISTGVLGSRYDLVQKPLLNGQSRVDAVLEESSANRSTTQVDALVLVILC